MPNDRQSIQRFLSANRSRGELSENKMARLDLDEGRRALGVVGESDGDIAALSVLAPAASHGEWAMEVVTRPEPGDLADLVAATSCLPV